MQINVPPIPSFNVPGGAGTVTGVSNVGQAKPIRGEDEPEEEARGSGPGPSPEQRDQPAPPTPANRRDNERRLGQDRRRHQVPVLLDTRVGERRKTQRREEDPPPPAVDFRV